MSLFYIVEILNHSGELQARHKISALPIRLGRSYHSDIILDDPHTAAEHAVIDVDANGKLNLRDLGSRNGVKLNGKTQTEVALDDDTLVQLGRGFIRVRNSDYTVGPELSNSHANHWQTWLTLAYAIVIIGALALSNAWLGDIANNKFSDYIITTIKWLSAAAMWAGIWALANRVFNGRANFAKHLLILSCAMLSLDALAYLYAILGFSLGWDWFAHYQNHLQIVVLATAIYFHLRLINTKRTTLKIICAVLALISSSLLLMSNYQRNNQYADNLYMSELLPPVMRLSRNHSLTEFDHAIQQLKDDIDAERSKALKEKAEKNNTNNR